MIKNLNLFSPILVFVILVSYIACDGPRGAAGPRGPEGPPGPEVLPISFEYEVDLLEDQDFEYCRNIPGDIEVYESDVMLAYVLEDYLEDDDLAVWRQLPITEFNDRGTLLFDFDFTLVDICIFLDADYQLGAEDEFEQTLIRAVHVPAAILSQNKANDIKSAGTLKELESILEVNIKAIPVK